jgi:hypothetical protein
MKPVAWMIGACALSGVAAVALLGTTTGIAVLFGMLGPLAIAAATWVLVERTYRASPERLTSLMVAGFAGKMVFFGAYVAVMLKLLSLPPIPFVASFTSYFIALHLMEAQHLRSLFAAAARGPRL